MYTEFEECFWLHGHIDSSFKILLGACLIIFGLSGILLNCWFIITFIKSHLLSFRSHLLILNMCTASLSRNILSGFPFAGSSAIAGRWLFGENCCNLFAFMHQLLGIFQITSLTVLCFERYLLTKKIKHGKELNFKFYIVSILFCWSYAIVFSVPPLFHYGSYACDITDTFCTVDWRSFSLRNTSFNFLVVIFAGIIPFITIIVTLWKTVSINKKLQLADRDWEQWSLTKSTIIMTSIVFILWIPQSIFIGWIIFSSWNLKFYSYGVPTSIIILAPLASEASTMVPLLCYLAGEPRIRTALLGRCKKNYGIIRHKRRPSNCTMITNQ